MRVARWEWPGGRSMQTPGRNIINAVPALIAQGLQALANIKRERVLREPWTLKARDTGNEMKNSSRRYERRVDAGECVICGKPATPGNNPDGMSYRTCASCRERHYARRRDVKAKQRT